MVKWISGTQLALIAHVTYDASEKEAVMFKTISDELWERFEPLLEPYKRTRSGDSKPTPFRNILNGILFQLKTGCQWDMIPNCYGSKSSIHEHFQRWVSGGVFNEVFRLNLVEYDEIKGIEWEWQAMDGSLVQAPVREGNLPEEGLGRNPTDRGRSGSKLHLLVDKCGITLGIEMVGANVHDSRLVGSTLAVVLIDRPKATPENPQNLGLDKGYDYTRVDLEVKGLGYQPHIRRIGEEKLDANLEKKHPARRWVVERTFAWLKGFRALRTSGPTKLA
jgi:putative transposase